MLIFPDTVYYHSHYVLEVGYVNTDFKDMGLSTN